MRMGMGSNSTNYMSYCVGECNVRDLYSPGVIMKEFFGGDGADNVTMMGRAKDL